MMKVTRDQAANIMSADMLRLHMDGPDAPIFTPKDVTRYANGAYGEIGLIGMTGAKLYRYKDKSGMPAYAIMGYSSNGEDVSKLAALIGY